MTTIILSITYIYIYIYRERERERDMHDTHTSNHYYHHTILYSAPRRLRSNVNRNTFSPVGAG